MLEEKHKFEMLKEVQTISSMASIHYIRQKEPLGLGHAILCAEQFIGDEPFAVLLGDDIMTSEEPALKQMIQAYETTNQSVIGVQKWMWKKYQNTALFSREINLAAFMK